MPAQTRRTGTAQAQKSQRDKKPSSGAPGGVPKRGKAKDKLEDLKATFAKLQETYDKADPEQKKALEDQRKLAGAKVEEQERLVESMDVDKDDPPNTGAEADEEQGNEQKPGGSSDHDGGNQNERRTPGPREESSSIEGDSGYGSDDEIGLVGSELESGGELVHCYDRRGFAGWCGVFQYGPQNAARYNMRALAEKPSDDQSKYPTSNSRIPRNGKAEGKIYQLLGVAPLSTDDESRMDLLNPQNWRTANGGTSVKPMKVMVRWFSPEGPITFEWRGAVKRQMYAPKAKYLAPRTIEYNGKIIVEMGFKIHKGDFKLIDTAVRLEKRHDEWKKGLRKRADRDPTPGLPLHSEQEQVSPKEEEEY